MKLYILIILLNICIIIQQIVIQGILRDIKQLKTNEEVLRKGINNLFKNLKGADNIE